MSEGLEKFLEGVVGIVEADTFARHSLWEQNQHHDKPMSWVEDTSGYIEQVSERDGRPITVSMFKAVVEGQSLLFWSATSQLVDYELIDKWMGIVMPKSARRGSRLNKTDAMNFHNVFR